jgi:hypothetical protein
VWQSKSIQFDKDETARGQDDNEALRGERSVSGLVLAQGVEP